MGNGPEKPNGELARIESNRGTSDYLSALEAEVSRLQQRLEASKAREREARAHAELMLASLLHEVRGPLQRVLAHARLLELALDEGAGRRRAAAIRSAVAIAALTAERTAEVMGWRPRQREENDLRGAESLGAVIAGIAERFGDVIGNGNSLNVCPLEDGGEVLVDRVGVEQVVGILLDNASRHSRGDTICVEARVERARGVVTVRVRDHGEGMSEQQQAHVFEPFVSYGERPTAMRQGLGLAIALRSARAMGGDLILSSTAGGGTTVCLEIPLREPAAIEDPGERVARAKRVLMVDDDAGLARLMGRVLALGGYEVDQARSAEEALLRLSAERYDCVVCDHRMPKGTGEWLVRRWPEILDPQTPVLILSGQVPAQEMEAYQRLGVRVVRKPVEAEVLYAAIEAAVAPDSEARQ